MLPLPADFLRVWKDDIVNIKELYRERKYRRCTVLCAEILLIATHPVLRTFVLFYQGICFESLGHISHDYSSNKIPLLEQARDAFISTNDLLPLPFLTTADGDYDEPQPSPACPTQDILDFYGSSPSTYPSPGTLPKQHSKSSIFDENPADVADHTGVAQSSTISGASLPGTLITNALATGASNENALALRVNGTINHTSRLSRSMSSQHALAEELVPSPLFSRAPLSRKEAYTDSAYSASPIPLVTLSKPLPPTPINRPLPSLPFNHDPHFVLKGKRIVIVPHRKTALATLISKFEGRSPFDSPPPEETGYEMSVIGPTPTTERFKRISATFLAKEEEDKENMPPPGTKPRSIANAPFHTTPSAATRTAPFPVTPCPKTHSVPLTRNPITGPRKHTTHLTTSQSLKTYNTHLSSFRTSLLSHITTVTTKITETHAVQLAHEDLKRRRFASMHSRCAPSAIPGPRSRSTSPKKPRESKPGPAKDVRLRSFWNLQIAEAQSKAVEEKGRERIERLKREGWSGVTKEAKGWKGSGYYAELRREVEREIDG